MVKFQNITLPIIIGVIVSLNNAMKILKHYTSWKKQTLCCVGKTISHTIFRISVIASGEDMTGLELATLGGGSTTNSRFNVVWLA